MDEFGAHAAFDTNDGLAPNYSLLDDHVAVRLNLGAGFQAVGHDHVAGGVDVESSLHRSSDLHIPLEIDIAGLVADVSIDASDRLDLNGIFPGLHRARL